jgi:hypothetical protein
MFLHAFLPPNCDLSLYILLLMFLFLKKIVLSPIKPTPGFTSSKNNPHIIVIQSGLLKCKHQITPYRILRPL